MALCTSLSCMQETEKNEIATDSNTEMTDTMTTQKDTSGISEERALELAREWASKAYRDLSVYNVAIELKDDGNYYVDYTLSNPNMVGGGPHFVISAKTGELISSRFAQ